MFSSKTDLWATPQELFDKYDAIYHFETDVCALHENAKCKRFFTPEMDGLKQEWTGVCWCNPPYGRQIGKWVEKACKSCATVVMLLPARTDTKWFHDYIYNKPNVEIRFIKGRLKFGDSKNSAPFPSMVVIFRAKE
jgi:phage N-6-adenine-methyltransferase